MENNDNKKVVLVCVEQKQSSVKDCIRFGFGLYLGWNLARTLKHLLLAKTVKKD